MLMSLTVSHALSLIRLKRYIASTCHDIKLDASYFKKEVFALACIHLMVDDGWCMQSMLRPWGQAFAAEFAGTATLRWLQLSLIESTVGALFWPCCADHIAANHQRLL